MRCIGGAEMGGSCSACHGIRAKQLAMVAMIKSGFLLLASCMLFLSWLCAPVAGAQCTVHPDNKCQATCNGTTFDVSKIFDFP